MICGAKKKHREKYLIVGKSRAPSRERSSPTGTSVVHKIPHIATTLTPQIPLEELLCNLEGLQAEQEGPGEVWVTGGYLSGHIW